MPYRVILPDNVAKGEQLPIVYLLHGGGGDFRDWSDYSDVATLAARGVILVMPEGHSSYYTNAVDKPNDRYEDYIVRDLVTDVESRFPVEKERSGRAIAGVSMGGFGAVKLALAHPELFTLAAGLSPAVDVPSRPFSVKRIDQWRRFRSIFGPWQGNAQRKNDPFVLARTVDPAKTPYIFLTCGEQEGLLPSNRQFAALLGERGFRYEFHTKPGGHDWNQWNGWVSTFTQIVLQHLRSSRNSG